MDLSWWPHPFFLIAMTPAQALFLSSAIIVTGGLVLLALALLAALNGVWTAAGFIAGCGIALVGVVIRVCGPACVHRLRPPR